MADRWVSEDDPEGIASVVPFEPPPPAFVDFTEFYRRELPALVSLAAAIAGSPRRRRSPRRRCSARTASGDRIERYDKPGAWVGG